MNAKGVKELPSSEHSVFFYGDDAPSSNIQFINQLKDISDTRKMTEDNYSIGGEVAELESIMAKKLGKEACVFFPTGTLANHIAIRQLGLPKTRAIVPEQSHIYQDSGDSVQQLSGINLVPLGGGDPYFDLPELKKALVNSMNGRVVNPVGVVVIETPVRRCFGRSMPYEKMLSITEYCKERDISTHLDGARLFIASAFTNVALEKYGALFDTVYISMWKYFRAPYGAILAGSKEFCENLFHVRRMFGGSLPFSSLSAALALDGLKHFEKDARLAVSQSKELLELLSRIPNIEVNHYEDESNIIPVAFNDKVNLQNLDRTLRSKGVFINPETSGQNTIHLTINMTILRKSNQELLKAFTEALETSVTI